VQRSGKNVYAIIQKQSGKPKTHFFEKVMIQALIADPFFRHILNFRILLEREEIMSKTSLFYVRKVLWQKWVLISQMTYKSLSGNGIRSFFLSLAG
jgi:hypothetical protein